MADLVQLANEWVKAHLDEYENEIVDNLKNSKAGLLDDLERPIVSAMSVGDATARFAIRCSIYLMEQLKEDLSRELRAEIDGLRSQLLERLDQLDQR